MNRRFRDRLDAGRQLAPELLTYINHQAIVLALPRGGVPVAAPIAEALQLPLDVCLIRKLGVPSNPELAMGAIDLEGRRYLNDRIVRELGISPATIDRVAQMEAIELARRNLVYRGNRPPLDLHQRIVIVVDDGLATGATMQSAINSIRLQQPAQIVVAVPVASAMAIAELRAIADVVICLLVPQQFYAIGSWYENFSQVTDAEVCELLGIATGSM